MKISMNIREELITEAMQLAHSTNRTETIHRALEDFIRNCKIESVKKLACTNMFREDYDHKKIRKENDFAINHSG